MTDITDDHLIPRSWYPDSTPAQLEKWHFPACRECNASLGVDEKRILQIFGLCLDPLDVRAEGIPDRVLRSLDPKRAGNEHDRGARKSERAKILRKLLPAPTMARYFPGLGPKDSGIDPRNNAPAIQLDAHDTEAFQRVGRKLVRGVVFKMLDSCYVEETHDIEVYIREEHDLGPLLEILDAHAERQSFHGPVSIRYAVVSSQKPAGAYEIILWGRLPVRALVAPKGSPTGATE
ncbi:MAG: hypothetical protein AB7N24_21920 [Dehalococcoidia bacterium]